jgi:hypothetical protein
MTNPNIIDMGTVAGSRLVAARVDRILPNILNVTGMTADGRVSRLGTLLVGRDGSLTPVWNSAGKHLLGNWAAKVLVSQIAARLPNEPQRQRERIW